MSTGQSAAGSLGGVRLLMPEEGESESIAQATGVVDDVPRESSAVADRESPVFVVEYMRVADGGAHVGLICDSASPTSLLTHWARDRTRGPKLHYVRFQSEGERESYRRALAALGGE